MKILKRSALHFFILNFVAISFYFLILSHLNYGISEEIMYSTPDARGYQDVSTWITTGSGYGKTLQRPFLFPLIISICSVFGVYGLWFAQFLFWLASINLIFMALKKLTKTLVSAYLGAFVVISNISLITITFHALAEITTTLLLSILGYFIISNRKRFKSTYFIHGCIGILSLLTVAKPAFQIPLLAMLILLPFIYVRQYIKQPKRLAFLGLMLLPVLIQYTIMKVEHNEFVISKIGETTFRDYFLARGIASNNKINMKEGRAIAKELSRDEQFDYIKEHKDFYNDLYYRNLEENINGYSYFLQYPKGMKHPKMEEYMLQWNCNVYWIHQYSIYFILFAGLLLVIRKAYPELLLLLFFTTLTAYYILISGISFWQGDRLVLPIIVTWSFLYVYTLFVILTGLSKLIHNAVALVKTRRNTD